MNRGLVKLLLRRESIVFGFVMLTALLLLFVAQKADQGVVAKLWTSPQLLAEVLLLQSLYILTKSSGWYIAWRSQAVEITYRESVSLFLMSAFVDLLVFPTAVSSDLFKLAYLKRADRSQKLSAILICRAATITPYVAAVFIFLITRSSNWIWAGFGFVAIAVGYLFKRFNSVLRTNWGTYIRIVAMTVAALFFDCARARCLLALFGLSSGLDFLGQFSVCHVLGILTALPFGLGTKDAGYFYFLNGVLSHADIAAFLILLRLTGEIPSALCGWLIAGRKTIAVWQLAAPQTTTVREETQ